MTTTLTMRRMVAHQATSSGLLTLVDRPRPSPDLAEVSRSLPWGSCLGGRVPHLTAFFGLVFFVAWALLRPLLLRNTWHHQAEGRQARRAGARDLASCAVQRPQAVRDGFAPPPDDASW
jgi:hypothetical protein